MVSGELWTHSYVGLILKNKLYTGVCVLHKKTRNKPFIESPIMPRLVIIDPVTFEKARAICKASDKRPDGHQCKTVHGKQLLTELLYCGNAAKNSQAIIKAQRALSKMARCGNESKTAIAVRRIFALIFVQVEKTRLAKSASCYHIPPIILDSAF